MNRWLRTGARIALAGFLAVAGVGHLVAPEPFLAQTPEVLPWRPQLVLVSGLVELALAAALLLAPRRWRPHVGWSIAAFLVAVFPGNVHQAVAGTDAFGLDTPTSRWLRLLVQPVLIAWALWSTGAWRERARVLVRPSLTGRRDDQP